MTGKRIRGIAFDVDGVFTDGLVWMGPGGEEFKAASFLDIMGVARARRAGILVAFISGEDTPFVHHLAARLGVVDLWTGCKDKAAAFQEFAARHAVATTDLGFVGDDINDVPAMQLAGIALAPPGAHRSALAAAGVVTERAGGHGAVREVLDYLADRDWTVEAEPSH